MLWTLFVTSLFVWCLGLATSLTAHGMIHVLPLMAAVIALVGTLQHRPII